MMQLIKVLHVEKTLNAKTIKFSIFYLIWIFLLILSGNIIYLFIEKYILDKLNNFIFNIFSAVIIFLVISLLILITLRQRLMTPINNLSRALKEAANKNYSKISLENHEELSDLIQTCNEMLGQLEQNENKNVILLKELGKKNEQSQQLLNKLILAQEEERKKIARELHDETSQSLAFLLMAFKSIEELKDVGKIHIRINQVKEIAAKILKDIHKLAIELRPTMIDEIGLQHTLITYINKYQNEFGIKVNFKFQGLEDRLPLTLEISLYRIIQEALTNIVKHSGAKNVEIVLNNQPDKISIFVKDDGCGFEYDEFIKSDKWKTCMGILGMRERAALINGIFALKSKKGMGTSLSVLVPLSKDLPA